MADVKKKVTVKVPARPVPGGGGSSFPGYGSGGVYWQTGETEAEVSEATLAQLKKDQAEGHPIMVIDHEEELAKVQALQAAKQQPRK